MMHLLFCLLRGSIIHFTIYHVISSYYSSRQSAFGFETRWQSSSGLGKALQSPASGTASATSAGHRNWGGGCVGRWVSYVCDAPHGS